MIRNCEVLGITKLAEHTKLAKDAKYKQISTYN